MPSPTAKNPSIRILSSDPLVGRVVRSSPRLVRHPTAPRTKETDMSQGSCSRPQGISQILTFVVRPARHRRVRRHRRHHQTRRRRRGPDRCRQHPAPRSHRRTRRTALYPTRTPHPLPGRGAGQPRSSRLNRSTPPEITVRHDERPTGRGDLSTVPRCPPHDCAVAPTSRAVPLSWAFALPNFPDPLVQPRNSELEEV